MIPSLRYRMLRTFFIAIGVNKMFDKKGKDFEKLLAECREKQKILEDSV